MAALLRFVSLSSVLISANLAFSQLSPATIDQSQGQIRGMRAFAVWPQLEGDKTPRDPTGYEVLLIRMGELRPAMRFPAGTWQLPPDGMYKVFVEGSWQVSPWPSVLSWMREPFVGRGMAATRAIVAAGAVRLEKNCPVPCVMWILHENSNVQTPTPYFSPEMLREVESAAAQKTGVLMPSGRAAVALYDGTTKRYLAVRAPVVIAVGKTTDVDLSPPKAGRAALIANLTRPAMVEQRPDDDVKVSLVTEDGQTVPPSLVTRTHRKVIATWSDVPSGLSHLDVKSFRCRLPDAEVRLGSGKVEYVERTLAPLPKLSLTIDVPEIMRVGTEELSIIDLSGQTEPIKVPVGNEIHHVELEVPAAPLAAVLSVGPWSVRERIDLSAGNDSSLTLAFHPIRVAGHVYYGDKGAKATIKFDTREWNQALDVTTDADGKYDALFVTPRTYVALVQLLDRAAPFVVPIDVESDMTQDFRLPANRYRFHVTNRRNGKPIYRAEVGIENTTEEGLGAFLRMFTDENGEATAEPLRPGRMRAIAKAEGFVASTPHEEPVVVDGQRVINLELEEAGDHATLTLLLPDGRPAAAAEVFVVGNAESSSILHADEQGHLQIPYSAKNATLLIRMRGAALLVRTWSGGDATWNLEQPAPALVVRGVRRDGTPASNAPGILWIDGIRVSAGALAWLTSTVAGTDSAGVWIIRDLPARAVDILLWVSTANNYQLVPTGLLDGMRKSIPYPWPSQTPVEVVE